MDLDKLLMQLKALLKEQEIQGCVDDRLLVKINQIEELLK
jgi:hypothetical protein